MKPRRSLLALLFVAILIPCAALGALGSRSLVVDASSAEERYRQRAEGALDAAAAAVEATALALPDGVGGALGFRASTAAELIEPGLGGASRPTTRGAGDGIAADLLLSVLTDVDRLEQASDLARAGDRIREFLERGPPSDLAAAALTALAAIEWKRGQVDAAREAWRRIVSEHPDSRDDRGLKRSFAARLSLAEMEESPVAELLPLYGDLVTDDVEPARTGTSAFKLEVRARLEARQMDAGQGIFPVGATLAIADEMDRQLARERQLRAALAGGARAWIAGGGRGVRTFVVPAETLAASDQKTGSVRVVVAVRDRSGREVEGGIAPIGSVVEAALGRSEVRALRAVGFAVGVHSGSRSSPTRSLGYHLEGVSLAVTGTDKETFRKQEQRRVVLTAGLSVLGLVVATAAAFATARAVRRELAAIRDRENFVAAVTHELKAPLASIRLLAEVLSRGGVEESKVREFADHAMAECDRLGRLVSGILELARIERRSGAEQRFVLVAGLVAEDAIRAFEPMARKGGFSVSLRVSDPGLTVEGDRDALVGALMNLLDNALKYSDRASEIELEVSAAGPHHAAFSVLDRGRGVPAAEARRIFEPFARLGSEMTRDRPGVGLGLALVSRIATAHGGTASCEPREGGGSRFTVVLPRSAAGLT